MSKLEVQTRNALGELKFFPTVTEAMEYAEAHEDVWKVSFGLPNGERVRLVRKESCFVYEDIITEVLANLEK